MAPPNLRAIAAQAAQQYGLGDWFSQQISQESGFQVAPSGRGRNGEILPNSSGAAGVAQIVPRWHPDAPPPSDPVGQIRWAAKYMAGLVNKYGSVERALSVYNSGRPDAYLNPGFAGGQTYNYVRSILGGGKSAAAPSPAPVAAKTSLPTPAPAAAPVPDLLAGIVDRTHEAVGLGQSSLFATLAANQPQAAPDLAAATPTTRTTKQPKTVLPSAPATGGGLTAVPNGLGTRAGLMVDHAILPAVTEIAQKFGVKVNSGYRSPQHNAEVNGAPQSDHLSGDAVDFVGTPEQMRALYTWAQGKFPYVEPWDQAGGTHVHISLKR